MQDERTLLMTGGTGKLGKLLSTLLPCDAPAHADLDILDRRALDAALDPSRRRAVVHLAAWTDQQAAAREPERAYRVNVLGTRNVAELAAARGLKLFYVSSDYVFRGDRGGYREDETPAPANWYGCTKYAGELEVRNAGGRCAILRTSFRPEVWGFPTAFTDVFTSADYTDVIAEELARAISWDIEGVLHVGTPVKTFFELARRRNPQVRPEKCGDASFPRRRDLCIDRWQAIRKEHGLQ